MPTGSLCAERNAIGSALTADLGLLRRDIKAVAVLSVAHLDRSSSSSSSSSAAAAAAAAVTATGVDGNSEMGPSSSSGCGGGGGCGTSGPSAGLGLGLGVGLGLGLGSTGTCSAVGSSAASRGPSPLSLTPAGARRVAKRLLLSDADNGAGKSGGGVEEDEKRLEGVRQVGTAGVVALVRLVVGRCFDGNRTISMKTSPKMADRAEIVPLAITP